MGQPLSAISAILLAATVAGAAVDGQTPSPAGTTAPTEQRITAVGCVTRNGVVDVDKGLRRLNMDPNGLALTTARVVRGDTARQSAVPGSVPEGTNSGTIPQRTIVGRETQQPDTLAFALTGEQLNALGEQVGKRVEVVGLLTRVPEPAVEQPRGTTGSSRDAAPVQGAGTREERPGEGSAHPSTELPKIQVVSFRAATGQCE